MAEKEMYDYLSVETPDYSASNFSVDPQGVLIEVGEFNQAVHEGDDASEETIQLDAGAPVFFATLEWEHLSEGDSGTIFDFYCDSGKGNGMARSFPWEHPTDGHTYTVKFRRPIGRTIEPANRYGIQRVQLKILGTAP